MASLQNWQHSVLLAADNQRHINVSMQLPINASGAAQSFVPLQPVTLTWV